jgi:predicted DNA-binding transcriptional regulator YafY
MAKRASASSSAAANAVTSKRAARLHRLLLLLGKKPQQRESLTRRLRLDVRGFYRDLKLLRSAGILVVLAKGRYALQGAASAALEKLPFPDPLLTLGEARLLAKGRTAAHRKLKEIIAAIEE